MDLETGRSNRSEDEPDLFTGEFILVFRGKDFEGKGLTDKRSGVGGCQPCTIRFPFLPQLFHLQNIKEEREAFTPYSNKSEKGTFHCHQPHRHCGVRHLPQLKILHQHN